MAFAALDVDGSNTRSKKLLVTQNSLTPTLKQGPTEDENSTFKPLSGRRVYKRACMACHTLSVWGAPKLGDRKAWTIRIKKGKEALYYSVLNGFKGMPPRGHCQFCTDDELKSAVDYMTEKSQAEK